MDSAVACDATSPQGAPPTPSAITTAKTSASASQQSSFFDRTEPISLLPAMSVAFMLSGRLCQALVVTLGKKRQESQPTSNKLSRRLRTCSQQLFDRAPVAVFLDGLVVIEMTLRAAVLRGAGTRVASCAIADARHEYVPRFDTPRGVAVTGRTVHRSVCSVTKAGVIEPWLARRCSLDVAPRDRGDRLNARTPAWRSVYSWQ